MCVCVKEQYVESTQISVNASVEVVCVQYVLCVYEHVYNQVNLFRGDSVTVQKGKVSASAWMDRKVVMMMASNCQPAGVGSVLRRQQDGSRIPVTCPESIICYNDYMGGVDRGDQLRGYYNKNKKILQVYFHLPA